MTNSYPHLWLDRLCRNLSLTPTKRYTCSGIHWRTTMSYSTAVQTPTSGVIWLFWTIKESKTKWPAGGETQRSRNKAITSIIWNLRWQWQDPLLCTNTCTYYWISCWVTWAYQAVRLACIIRYVSYWGLAAKKLLDRKDSRQIVGGRTQRWIMKADDHRLFLWASRVLEITHQSEGFSHALQEE